MLSTGNIARAPQPSNNESEIKFKPSKKITKEALKEFASLPCLGISALDPRASFFIIGLQMFLEPPGGGYLSGFNNSMGFLLMASSPVVAIFKTGFAATTITAGVVGTAVLAPSCLIEKGVRFVLRSDKLNDPELKRQALMKAFVKRMSKLIDTLAQGEESRRYMVENPSEICILSAISLAFNSKSEYGKTLIMADGNKLTEKDLETLDPLFISYFEGICLIRDNLRAISYEKSQISWTRLMTTLNKLCLEEPLNLSPNTITYYKNAYETACELSNEICQDQAFIRAWNDKFHN